MMENPIAPEINKDIRRTPPGEDPLNLYKDAQVQYDPI